MVKSYSLVIFTALLLAAQLVFAGLSGSLEEQSIIERIKPKASVYIDQAKEMAQPESAVAQKTQDIGASRYEQTCKMCHETGLADSPKLGDKKAWASRIAQGMDVLFKHAIEGMKAMPPKGGCSSCSDEEIKKAVEYMVSHSK